MPVDQTSGTSPYLLGLNTNVTFRTLVTAGDLLPNGEIFAGSPDGLAAFDNFDGTITILVVHQLPGSAGLVRDHGTTGSFIDRLVIDKATLQLISAGDLVQHTMRWSDSKDIHYATTVQFSKLSCADLADPSAYYNVSSGMGSQARILLTPEESGLGGRVFATILSGSGAGTSWELPFLGNMTFETAVANPLAQDRTIIALTDDTTGGQVYFYVGEKQSSGNEITRAGLMNGELFGLRVANVADETGGVAVSGTFTLQEIGPSGNVSDMTGSQIEAESDAEGVTGFLRPEDAVWDPANPNILYFTTTASLNGHSRLYQATFVDIRRPELGGTITALLEGSEGHRTLDNIEISGGRLILQEDPGDNAYLARMWEYDLASDSLIALAQFDAARFTPGSPGFITQYEESSGVLDVSDLLGDADTRAYLVDAQLHVPTGDPATYQLGQLMLMRIDDVATETVTFRNAVDTYIREARPASTYGTALTLQVDGDAGMVFQTLLRFSSLFGDGEGQIPLGATITSAMLSLSSTNSSGTGAGLYRLTSPWGAQSTWSSLGNGIQVGVDTVAAADLTVTSTGSGLRSFDVTASLTAWLAGADSLEEANAANLGWAFIANGADGWDFSSSESSAYPTLVATYTMPPAAGTNAALRVATPELDVEARPAWHSERPWIDHGRVDFIARHAGDLIFGG